MCCRAVNEYEVRKRIQEHVVSVRKEQKQAHFMNESIIDDAQFFEVVNNKYDVKTVSKIIKSSEGLKRIPFNLNEPERDSSISHCRPRIEIFPHSRYCRKSGRNIKRNGRFYSDSCFKKEPKLNTTKSEESDNGILEVDKRRKSIHEKLTSFIHPVFTEKEECDINERADMYSSTMLPHERYFLLQENVNKTGMRDSETLTESSDFVYSTVQKKRRRSYTNIDRFVTHHSNDYSDNTQILPEGTKLLKPPDKLVELVAQTIDESPDGMLQVQQIYTVLQNKFPYFRYMDKGAISSWRSSVRHALYQKWFQKIKFTLESINTKGCFWCINYSLTAKEWAVAQSPACRLKNFCIPSSPRGASNDDDDDDDDDDIKDEAEVTNSLSENTTENSDVIVSQNTEELKDAARTATEYGIGFPEFVPEVRTENKPNLNIPMPVKDPDPMLTYCVPDWNQTPKSKTISVLDGIRGSSDKQNLACISPSNTSHACEVFETPPCSPSTTWELSQNDFFLFSPLSNSCSNEMQLFPD